MLKPQSNLSETTERAAALLDELRLRLNTPPPVPDDLDRELQAYFSAASNTAPGSGTVLNEIRDRVIEGVVDRIIRAWEEPSARRSGTIEGVVIERLIERVLERLGTDSIGSRR